MNKQTVTDIDVAGRRVLMRVDFNVPLQDGVVSDDARIVAAIPTIQFLLDQGASVVLMSHLGRPKGKPDPRLSLRPVIGILTQQLGRPVGLAPDCVGSEVQDMVRGLQAGDVLLLENLRFHSEEEGKIDIPEGASKEEAAAAKSVMRERQMSFAQQLASLGDVYVNDAFGTAHRAHASVSGVSSFFKQRVAGFLMEKELEYLGGALANPQRPFVAILGGAKISGKIDVISSLLDKVDTLLIGGGMAYTFFLAQGEGTGNSLVEKDKVSLALDILAKADSAGVKLVLPVDTVVADDFSADATAKIVGRGGIEEGWEGLDIGPKSRKLFADEITKARTVVWNGPMGCFEMAPFAAGTQAIAQAVADTDCVSIIGGGDSASAIKNAGLTESMTHISTGGGASLEFLEGKVLPGVAALCDKT